MIKPKENDQHVKAVEYSHTLEKLLIMERENSAAIRSELEAAERERDEATKQRDESGVRFHKAVQYGAEIERERDELRKVLQETQVGLIDAINHASQLQAELSRRDAAAGEPDYWQFKSVSGDWIGIGESGMRQAVSEGVEVRPLYTAAPPAVLPGEVEELSMLIRRLVHSLKNSNPHSGLLWSVPDFMHKKGYWKANDCLRGEND